MEKVFAMTLATSLDGFITVGVVENSVRMASTGNGWAIAQMAANSIFCNEPIYIIFRDMDVHKVWMEWHTSTDLAALLEIAKRDPFNARYGRLAQMKNAVHMKKNHNGDSGVYKLWQRVASEIYHKFDLTGDEDDAVYDEALAEWKFWHKKLNW